MKRFVVVIVSVILLFSCFGYAQSAGIVSEAQTKLSKERHEALVEKAKSLLQDKERLTAELAAVNAKLDKLDKGEDIQQPETSNSTGALTFYSYPNYCCNCLTTSTALTSGSFTCCH